MKKLIIIIISTFILVNNVAAVKSGNFAIEKLRNVELVSYKMPMSENFKSSLVASLKSGKVVKVEHTVKIRPVDKWIGWLAEKKYAKYYKYNLINNQYFVGVKEDRLRPVVSLDDVLNDASGLKKAPFLPKNVLQQQQAYEIDFTVSINPLEEKTSTFLLFKGENLKERLHSAVHYIYQ